MTAPLDAPAPERSELSAGWRKSLAVADIVAKIAIPVLLLVGAWQADRLAGRIQTGPEYVRLAIELLDRQDPAQSAGLRRWAVELIQHYSDVKLDGATAVTLVEGAPLTGSTRRLGFVSLRPETVGTAEIAETTVEIRYSSLDGTEGVRDVMVTPEGGAPVRKGALRVQEVMRVWSGPTAFLLQLERIDNGYADFEVLEPEPPSPP